MVLLSESTSLHVKFAAEQDTSHLFRRKGGGGKGGGSKGSSGKGSSSASRASSAAKKAGASETFVKSRGGTSFSVSGTKSPAYAYSKGGGKRITLGSNSPFSGREAGGGNRETIYGTSRFGSGYPYGGYGSYVNSRPFPYYFYPTPTANHYYGGDEYIYINNSERPGGNLTTALVQPSYNTSTVTYRLVGDNSSVVAVFDALVANCSVSNSSSVFASFEPSGNTWPVPEQVVQYYRASSFALSLDIYNNTAALPSNAPASNDSSSVQMADTPLPSGLNTTFLQCVNYTIAASVPLVEAKKGLSGMDIAKIVLLSLMGFTFLAVIVVCCCSDWCRGRKKGKKNRERFSDTPKIRVVDSELPPYSGISSKSFPGRGAILDCRPASIDERTLAANTSGGKERWSYASSAASSRTEVNESTVGHGLAKVEGQPSPQPSSVNQQESGNRKASWFSKLRLPGRPGYQSVKHQSTSSVVLPLTDAHSSHDITSPRLSPTYSPYSSRSPSPSCSRSPSPSPISAKFPLIHAEDKRPVG